MLAWLIFSLLPDKPPNRLSLDRTNCKFDKTDINILMLSVCYHGVAIPLLWKMLPKRGNSNANERQELIHECIDVFGTSTITAFMADREFVGEVWFEDLIRKRVPFYIRICENMKVRVAGKGIKKAFWLFNQLKTGSYMHYKGLVYLGDNLVYLSGINTFNLQTGKIEFVLIASFNQQDQALINYRSKR